MEELQKVKIIDRLAPEAHGSPCWCSTRAKAERSAASDGLCGCSSAHGCCDHQTDGTARGGVALAVASKLVFRFVSSEPVRASGIYALSTVLNLWRLCWPVVETRYFSSSSGLSREQQAAPASSFPPPGDGFFSPVKRQLRQIFESPTQEQRRNQDLLASLSLRNAVSPT